MLEFDNVYLNVIIKNKDGTLESGAIIPCNEELLSFLQAQCPDVYYRMTDSKDDAQQFKQYADAMCRNHTIEYIEQHYKD